MSDNYTIKIDGDGKFQVILNGVELKNIITYEIVGGVNRVPEITLTMNEVSVDISLEGFVFDNEGKPN